MSKKRYRYTLVIEDVFSKFIEIIPIYNASDQAITRAFVDQYLLRYGAPTTVITDNAPQFFSRIVKNICHITNIKHIVKNSPRESNSILIKIASFIKSVSANWDQYLSYFVYTMQSTVNQATGYSPAELFIGHKLLTPLGRLIRIPYGGISMCLNLETKIQNALGNTNKSDKTNRNIGYSNKQTRSERAHVKKKDENRTRYMNKPIDYPYTPQIRRRKEILGSVKRPNKNQYEELKISKKSAEMSTENRKRKDENGNRETLSSLAILGPKTLQRNQEPNQQYKPRNRRGKNPERRPPEELGYKKQAWSHGRMSTSLKCLPHLSSKNRREEKSSFSNKPK